jgi:murein DD-endopeptidase MepM/ murein hydrolase activator NlpD
LMNKLPRSPKSILIVAYVIVLHVVAIYLVVDRSSAGYARPTTGAAAAPTAVNIRDEPPAEPGRDSNDAYASTSNRPQNTPPADPGGLVIPVLGVKGNQLVDSFADARSPTRVHDAIDIAAPAGTPVIAAADGKIIKFFDSLPGGITIYQLSMDHKYVYYYAHLQRRSDDIKVGDMVSRGKTIAFVGDTGNAGTGNFHLHFSIAAVPDPKRYWEGVYINPYPLLKDQGN